MLLEDTINDKELKWVRSAIHHHRRLDILVVVVAWVLVLIKTQDWLAIRVSKKKEKEEEEEWEKRKLEAEPRFARSLHRLIGCIHVGYSRVRHGTLQCLLQRDGIGEEKDA